MNLKSPQSRRTRLRYVIAAALAIATLVLTACGSNSSSSKTAATAGGSSAGGSSSSGLSAAVKADLTAQLEAARATSKWQAPGPSLDASSLKGKSVFVLSDGNNQFSQSFLAGVSAGAKAVGMTMTTGNGGGVSTRDVQVLENAINAKTDAIILLAQEPSTLSTALLKAKAAGIPVIEAFIGDPRLPTAEETGLGVYADATYCYSCTANLIAAYELLRSDGKVVAAVQQFPGQPASAAVVKGWKDSMAKYCPSTCTSTYQDIPLTSNNTQAMANAAQVAAQNSKTTLLLPVYDFQIAYEKPAVTAAGASDRIDIDSENADLAQMQDLKNGTAVKVNVGNPVAWDGWGTMDQTLRALLKMTPSTDEKLPVRMFDVTNIASIDLAADPATWYGGADYAASYAKLWGVGSS